MSVQIIYNLEFSFPLNFPRLTLSALIPTIHVKLIHKNLVDWIPHLFNVTKAMPFFKKKLIYGFLIAAFRKITKHGVMTFKSHPKKSRKDMCTSIKISKDIVLMLMDFYNISVKPV